MIKHFMTMWFVFVLIIAGAMVLIGCSFKNGPATQDDSAHSARSEFGMSSPEPPTMIELPSSGMRSVSRSPGIEIYWAGDIDGGASTLDVVNATIGRIQLEQDSHMASDQNARALAFLMQARQELEGKQATTDDGLPILE